MTWFTVRNGSLEKLPDIGWPDNIAADWLVDQLAMHDGILPERLLGFGEWEDGALHGLYALDREGSLVVLAIAQQTCTKAHAIAAAEHAWNLRNMDAAELNSIAKGYFAAKGIDAQELALMHQETFSLKHALQHWKFNCDQRLIMLTPGYTEAARTSLAWRRFELSIEAYMVRFSDVEGRQLAVIDADTTLSGNALVSLPWLLINAPVSKLRRLRNRTTRGGRGTHRATNAGESRTADNGDKATGSADSNDAADDSDCDHDGGGRVQAAITRRPVDMVLAATGWFDSLNERWLYAILGSFIGLYIVVYSYLTVINHQNFGSFGFDLGIFDQGVWLLSQGAAPFITVRGLHLFGDHLSLILLLIAPLYKVWADARLLLILQTIALALGAVPVFLLARARLKNAALALSIAVSYLLYPALQWVNFDQFHPESFAAPSLLFALYFANQSRYLWFSIAAGIALLTKEDMALVVALMGIYIALRYNRKAGIATSAVAVVWFVIGLKLILPLFNGAGFFYIENFSRFGQTPTEVVMNSITHPGLLLSTVTQGSKLTYLTQLLAPVLFLPLVAIGLFAVCSPTLFSNLVSQQGYMDSIQYHYAAAIIPFVFAASIAAFKKLDLSETTMRMSAIGVLAAALVANILVSPSPLSQNFAKGYWNLSNERRATIEAAVAKIPSNAVVSAQYYLVPHLAHRERIYEFPNPFAVQNWGVQGEHPASVQSIEYVIVDKRNLPDQQQLIFARLAAAGFSERFNKEDIVVLSRK
ncbi:MAG TPA: DUF2079 domain-containing protein [Candidatus Aquicultor sp.]|jgi:uncharacterized membrane protein